MSRASSVAFRLCLMAIVASLSTAPLGAARAQDAGGVEVAAGGLTNPRGVAWGPDGGMLVAEAGSGGEAAAGEGAGVAPPVGPYGGGPTAAVASIQNRCPVAVAVGLPSAISATGEVLGASAVAFAGDARFVLVSGGGAAHGNPGMANGVYRIDADGTATLLADLGQWVQDNPVAAPPTADADPEGVFPQMIPASDGKSLWIVERNSGQLLSVSLDGTVTRKADFSVDNQGPTTIAAAADRGVYVGFFSAAPFADKGAAVMKVGADGSIATVWKGLTMVSAIAVDADGTLYATEYSKSRGRAPFSVQGSGRLVKQIGAETLEVVASGINLPIGLGIGPDGAFYVSEPGTGANNGQGSVLRVTAGAKPVRVDTADVQEPICGDAATPPPAAGADTTELIVRVFDFGFEPATLTVNAGATVLWVNTGAAEHEIVGSANGAQIFDSGPLATGGTFLYTFAAPGTYDYACSIHPQMTGRIIVQ
ncbi:MAG: ScyD/ScyE family protein [Thermomicrobiales bacterium]